VQKDLNDIAFRVYPNPVRSTLNINIGSNAIVYLTDQSGKTLFTKSINGSGFIDVSKFPSGIYFLKNNTTGETKKIVISR